MRSLALVLVLAAILASSASPHRTAPARFTITALSGSLHTYGRSGTGPL